MVFSFWRVLALLGIVGLALLPYHLLERDGPARDKPAAISQSHSTPFAAQAPVTGAAPEPLPLSPVVIPDRFRAPLELPPTPASTPVVEVAAADSRRASSPQRPAEPPATVPATAAPPPPTDAGGNVVRGSYEAMFIEIGHRYGLDWRLLASIAYQESRLDPHAVGKDGEFGLMQIMPSTWEQFAPQVGVTDPYDPYSNALVGAHYLVYLQDRFHAAGHSEIYWAVGAYNWGPSNMQRLLQEGAHWGELPLIRQHYVWNVLHEAANPTAGWWQEALKAPVYGSSP